jgi:hypothetical protein
LIGHLLAHGRDKVYTIKQIKMRERLKLLFNYLQLLLPYWDKSLLSLLCVGIGVVFGLANLLTNL